MTTQTTQDKKTKDQDDKQMMLAPVGNLDNYVRAINQVPMLEEEDEKNLARRLRDYGDIEAARKLVLSKKAI